MMFRLPLNKCLQSYCCTRLPSLLQVRYKMMMNENMKQSPSDNIRKDCLHIFSTAVNSVLPRNMVQNTLKVNGNMLTVQDASYNLNHNVYVMAFGKAALGMVRAAEDVLGDHVIGGIASVPVGVQESLLRNGKEDLLPSKTSKVKVIEGSPNNIPDESAHRAALEIRDLANSLRESDIGLTLITGGGSALLPAPIPPITLEDMAAVTKLMSRNGANIHQLNTLRKNLELLKGGALAGEALPAPVISLILSDVINSPLDLIASGPTVADYSTPRQCRDIFSSLGIMDQVPDVVKNMLRTEAKKGLALSPKVVEFGEEDSPMIGPQPKHSCCNAQNVLVGSNEIAVNAAYKCAQSLGYLPFILDYGLDGEAKDVGVIFSALAEYFCLTFTNKREIQYSVTVAEQEVDLVTKGISKTCINDIVRLAEKACNCGKGICILAGGETTVTVTGKGIGGRNQEMALAAAIDMDERLTARVAPRFDIGFLSAGTDGQDGPTDAAGAFAEPLLVELAQKQGLDPNTYLSNNDSYTFYQKVHDGQDLVITGLTGTNVMDLQVLIIHPR